LFLESNERGKYAQATVAANSSAAIASKSAASQASSDDWPTLEQASTVSPSPIAGNKPDGKLVRFRSSATESTDSGSEDLYRLSSSRVKRTSTSDSNEDMKHSQYSTSDVISDDGPSGASSTCEADEISASLKGIPKLTHHGSLSSDEAELDGNDGAQGSASGKRRSSKQKWVPLPLPESPQPSRLRRKQNQDRSESDKRKDKENNTPVKDGENTGKVLSFK